VINGLLFYGVGNWLQGFEVKTLFAGMIGAAVYSVLSWLLAAIIIDNNEEK
jgi:putative membrane protein